MVYTAAHEKQKYLPPSVSGNLQCMAAVGIFAFGFPAAEQLLETWGIISLITIRNGLALALLIGLLARAQGLNTLRHLPWAFAHCSMRVMICTLVREYKYKS